MKYTAKFTLEIKMCDFYKYAIPKVSKKSIGKLLKQELYQAWCGVTNGEWGGNATDWVEYVYYNLWEEGWIEQTDLCIKTYGKFEKIK